MKVLFVSNGKSKNGISPITYNQGESLKRQGVEVDYFIVKGKGIKGYLGNIYPLRRKIKEGDYEMIHAHYSFSAFMATLAGAKPLVVSLMGSDLKAKLIFKFFIKLCSKFIWQAIIVKSEDMARSLRLNNISIIPNGVNLKRFKPLSQKECQEKLAWDQTKKHILFAANPERPEKNYTLAKEAIRSLKDNSLEVHYLMDISNEEVPLHHNAADVVLLTSLWEGSPNVNKEAMACNKSIIATNVNDVKWLFEKGMFNINESYDLSLEHALKLIKK